VRPDRSAFNALGVSADLTWHPLGCSLLRYDGNGVNLHKKIGVCQCRDEECGDDGWIRAVAPDFLKCLESSLSRLPMQDIDIPLDHVVKSGPASRQSCFNIVQHLFCLRSEVALADDVARGIHRILPTDIDCRCIAAYDNRLSICGILVQFRRIEMLHISIHLPLLLFLGESLTARD
jgi:hypothetical protein